MTVNELDQVEQFLKNLGARYTKNVVRANYYKQGKEPCGFIIKVLPFSIRADVEDAGAPIDTPAVTKQKKAGRPKKENHD